MIALLSLSLLGGCLGFSGSEMASPYTDEDAGTGYGVDLAGEDLVSGEVLPGHYHPIGYAASTVHGRDLKLQVTDCRLCHGQDLTGGPPGAAGGTTTPPSCDSCHKQGWRTDCTMCHGTAGGTGAPPRDLNGETDPKKISFPGHAAHLSGRITAKLDCIQCHRKPTDVLSAYHVFDASPRRGENNLSGGLSPQGVYDPVLGKCDTTYCHGNGRTPGTVMKTAVGPLACSGCHPDVTTNALWNTMSGDHNKHLRENGVTCSTCHQATVAQSPSVISDPSKHVDGVRQVALQAGLGTITYDPATRRCNGTCHNENHNNKAW